MAFKKPLIFCASMLLKLASELMKRKLRLRLSSKIHRSGRILRKVQLDGSLVHVQQVSNYTYLGVVISSDRSMDRELSARIWKA